MLLIGQTGIGKSSLIVQMAITWAINKPFFGIRPQRALKILNVQAENDLIDQKEVCAGVLEGLALNGSELAEARRNVHVMTEHTRGAELIKRVESEIKLLGPDLVCFDPIFAYLEGGVSDQEKVSHFLRVQLQPMLERNAVGAIIVHHTPKTPKDKIDWGDSDYVYLGSGSAEFANWARAVAYLRRIKDSKVFKLLVPKRGERAGICDESGAPTNSVHIRHSNKRRIFWEPANGTEVRCLTIPDSERQLFAVWHKLAAEESLGVSIADMADETKQTTRSINRHFERGAVLEFNGETLFRDNGRIYLKETL
jgi:hypothetical protein